VSKKSSSACRSLKGSGLVSPEFTENLFAKIITESKQLQSKNYRLVGFQESMARLVSCRANLRSNLVYILVSSLLMFFEGVEEGSLDIGVVPVETASVAPSPR